MHYREPTLFACSVHWRISPSRASDVAGDGCFIFEQDSNVYRSTQLGCRRQSNGSCWCHIKRDVHPGQSISTRQARPNAHQLSGSSVQHFSCRWLIAANQSLTHVRRHHSINDMTNSTQTRFGFSNFAETWNGRLAMLGFVIGLGTELLTGQGILSQIGL